MFPLHAFLATDFLSVEGISFHAFVLNSKQGIYRNYEYTASCTMYLPLLEVAVGRLACEHHESIFLNSKLLLLSLGTWSNSAANYHKKVISIFRSHSSFSGVITITKQLQMNRSCFGPTIIKLFFIAYQHFSIPLSSILFHTSAHIKKVNTLVVLRNKLTRCFHCRMPIG